MEVNQKTSNADLPKLRRVVIVIDFDGEKPRTNILRLYRTRRIDSYRPEWNGKKLNQRMGWSRALDFLRRQYHPLLSYNVL